MSPSRRRIAFATGTEQPFSEINTTPIIDVMLVLLIMFIITLPLMTHAVKIDIPPDGETQAEPEIHRLDIDSAGRLSWDGAPVAEAALAERLAAFGAESRDGFLHFRADPETRYEDFDRVLATVKRARIERLAFVGNDRFARAY
ncbi:MAG TPA: biopolymer transporter ExbD [Allosphingosinicella sp.]|nr:biopolymer transporter ExbD [Allosphingosinicella sp.]